MADSIPSDFFSFSKQLIEETVHAVIKNLAKDNSFSQSVFKTPQAAKYLQLSPSFLTRLRAKGKGPPYIHIESAIRYQRSDIDDWLGQRVTKPAHDSQTFQGTPQFYPQARKKKES